MGAADTSITWLEATILELPRGPELAEIGDRLTSGLGAAKAGELAPAGLAVVDWASAVRTPAGVAPLGHDARKRAVIHTVGTTPDPVRYLCAHRLDVPCMAHGHRVPRAATL
jgi:hypothetical protein